MRLTYSTCKNAKPKDKPYKLADGGGLYMEVMPNGSKYWRLKYRFGGKEKRLAFGTFPAVSIQEAREEREKAKKILSKEMDPSHVKKEDKRRRQSENANTFEIIAREWHSLNRGKWSGKYSAHILTRLEANIFPEIGGSAVNAITSPMLLDTIRKIEKRGAYDIAHRILRTCGQIFRYAIVTGRAERDPSADLRGALQHVQSTSYAMLDLKEVPAFLQKLERNDARLYIHTRLAIKLLMLTFVRTSELINATWDEIDLPGKEWIIPAERMKMRKAHIVPLSRQSVAILEQLKDISGIKGFVFPSAVKLSRSMSNNTILKALERMGYKGKATGHGFRALAMSTIKEKLGYRHEVVDRQLAHARRNKVDAAYDRAEFLDERRKMMQEWADYLDNCSIQKL